MLLADFASTRLGATPMEQRMNSPQWERIAAFMRIASSRARAGSRSGPVSRNPISSTEYTPSTG